VKLLRFLGERTFERVGSNKTLTADVRLVTATNRKLADLVKTGAFREDLYFRLRVVEIYMPPLRERGSDVALLAEAFLKEFAKEHEKPVVDFTAEAITALMTYEWPGNVRELRSEIERAVVLSQRDRIELKDLSPAVQRMPGPGSGERSPLAQNDLTVREAEKQLVIRALKEANGNRTLAARKIGISRRTLHRKLHSYHLEGF
jgi:DNA-binding NtrC family response regulator